jgi:peroxiredoxin
MVPENVQVMGISTDPPADGQRLQAQVTRDCREDRPFILLDPYPLRLVSDPDGRLIGALGLLRLEAAGTAVAEPATLVIDPAGVVRWVKAGARDDADVGGPSSASRAALRVAQERPGGERPHLVAPWWIGQPGG